MEQARGASGVARRRGTSTVRTCAAAASGPPSQRGGARLRRRTGLAMRPSGAAVVRIGVGRRWPRALLGGPSPWADAGRSFVMGTWKGRGLRDPTRCTKEITVVEQEFAGVTRRTTWPWALVVTVAATSAVGERAAAACGLLGQNVGARLRRLTDPARRPLGAAAAGVGIGRRWPRGLLGEPAPWAGDFRLRLAVTWDAEVATRTGLALGLFDDVRCDVHSAEKIWCAAGGGSPWSK